MPVPGLWPREPTAVSLNHVPRGTECTIAVSMDRVVVKPVEFSQIAKEAPMSAN